MTDVELAKQWVKDNADFCRSHSMNAYDFAERGFLAGLKAGRPKWHKVAEGDLPEEQKEYWCKVFYYESEETFNAFLWFDPSTKGFKFREDIDKGTPCSFDVKAWCDISQYEE